MKDLTMIPNDQKYLLFAALRGPDLEGSLASTLKAITSKLRTLVFDPEEVAGAYYDGSWRELAYEVRSRYDGMTDEVSWDTLQHYRDHLVSALTVVYECTVIPSTDDQQALKELINFL